MNTLYREQLTFAENNRANRLMRRAKKPGYSKWHYRRKIQTIKTDSLIRNIPKMVAYSKLKWGIMELYLLDHIAQTMHAPPLQ